MAKKKEEIASKVDELAIPDIPDEAKKRLEEIKEKLDKFKDKVLERFDEYVLGIALLPQARMMKKRKKSMFSY